MQKFGQTTANAVIKNTVKFNQRAFASVVAAQQNRMQTYFNIILLIDF